MFECPVCYEKTNDVSLSQGCKHLQHTTCMTSWLARGQNSCPVCRAQLVKRYEVGRRVYYLNPQAKIIRVTVSHYDGKVCCVVHGEAVLRAAQNMVFAKLADARKAKSLV
jgi:Ring finger domain